MPLCLRQVQFVLTAASIIQVPFKIRKLDLLTCDYKENNEKKDECRIIKNVILARRLK